MAVEGKLEGEGDCGGPAVGLGQHRVLLDLPRRAVELVQVDEGVTEAFWDA